MRWKIKTSENSEPVSVELISQDAGVYTFKVGDKVVSLNNAKAFPFSISANSQNWSLESWTTDRWRVSQNDQTWTVEPIRADQKSAGQKNEVRTQMPGRVLKVLVQAGDKVAPRQTLMIIEAMKMENEIRSDSNATVESVEVAQGQSVESGTLLLKFAS